MNQLGAQRVHRDAVTWLDVDDTTCEMRGYASTERSATATTPSESVEYVAGHASCNLVDILGGYGLVLSLWALASL